MSCSKWEKVKLGDILNFRRGHDLPKTEMEYGQYPVVGSNGIIGYHKKYTTESPCITVGRSGNIGNSYICFENCWAHNTTLYIDDFKGNYPKFIYYLLKTLNLANYGGGSAVPTLNRNHIHPIELYYPRDFKEQTAIANILSSLDEKIEVNNQINKTLEAMAQELFKHWFVDFEFPNENGKPYKSSGGEMVESELGMIPNGWGVFELSELIKVIDNRGKTPPQEYCKTSYPIIDVKALSGDSRIIDYDNCMKYVSEETYMLWFRSGHPIEGDILLSTVGSLAEMKIFYGNIGCIAQNVVALRCLDISNLYLYQYLKHIKNDIVSYNIGSVQPSIKITHIIKHKILKPKREVAEKFITLAEDITNLIYNNNLQIKNIKNTLDTLLPKLMSGEIRVPIDEEN